MRFIQTVEDVERCEHGDVIGGKLRALEELGLSWRYEATTDYVTATLGAWTHTVSSSTLVEVHVEELMATLWFAISKQGNEVSVSTPRWEQVDA